MTADELLRGGQTESGAFRVARHERVENRVLQVVRDAGSVVLNLDLGLLTVMPDPALRLPGAEVFLDGDKIGALPMVRKKVPAGEHQFVVRWPGDVKAYRRVIVVPASDLAARGHAYCAGILAHEVDGSGSLAASQ